MANQIIIQDWQKGVASSPFTGFASMVGVDIFRKPGIIQNAPGLVQLPAITFTGLQTAQVIDANGNIYIGTSDGNFYKNNILIQSGIGFIHDMVIVQNYIVISKSNTTLDLFGDITSGAPVYVPGWRTGLNTSSSGYKKMVLGQDNVLYIANEGALASQTGLYPTFPTASGAISNASCLSTGLPYGRVAQTICEMNRYIVIVTSFGNGTTGKTRVYFMDRGTLDPSKTSFSLSIGVDIPERKINQIVNQNNRLVMFGPDTGTFYTTNSTSYAAIAMLPNRQILQSYVTLPNAVTLLNNEILFGIGLSVLYTGSYQVGQGIFSLQGSSVVTKAISSTGNYDLGPISFGSILVTNTDTYQVGYQSTIGGSSVYLLDSTGTNSYLAQAAECWFETAMYDTGTYLVPRAFQNIQFNLANNLVAGQTITVAFRTATNEQYSVPVTFAYAKYGTVGNGLNNSFKATYATRTGTNIQLRVTLDSGPSAIPGNEVQLQSIILT